MNDVTVVIELTGYQAEVLRLLADRSGKTVDQLVNSFFHPRCIAPLKTSGASDMTEEQNKVAWGCAQAVGFVAVLAALLALLAWREGSFRRRVMEADPSGTSLRVCDEVDAKLAETAFGRACVQVTNVMRKIGGDL